MPVESGAFTALAYDATAQRLRIRFQDGHTYEYRGVPPPVHAGLLAADSKGRYFNTTIRGQFPHQLVIPEAP